MGNNPYRARIRSSPSSDATTTTTTTTTNTETKAPWTVRKLGEPKVHLGSPGKGDDYPDFPGTEEELEEFFELVDIFLKSCIECRVATISAVDTVTGIKEHDRTSSLRSVSEESGDGAANDNNNNNNKSTFYDVDVFTTISALNRKIEADYNVVRNMYECLIYLSKYDPNPELWEGRDPKNDFKARVHEDCIEHVKYVEYSLLNFHPPVVDLYPGEDIDEISNDAHLPIEKRLRRIAKQKLEDRRESIRKADQLLVFDIPTLTWMRRGQEGQAFDYLDDNGITSRMFEQIILTERSLSLFPLEFSSEASGGSGYGLGGKTNKKFGSPFGSTVVRFEELVLPSSAIREASVGLVRPVDYTEFHFGTNYSEPRSTWFNSLGKSVWDDGFDKLLANGLAMRDVGDAFELQNVNYGATTPHGGRFRRDPGKRYRGTGEGAFKGKAPGLYKSVTFSRWDFDWSDCIGVIEDTGSPYLVVELGDPNAARDPRTYPSRRSYTFMEYVRYLTRWIMPDFYPDMNEEEHAVVVRLLETEYPEKSAYKPKYAGTVYGGSRFVLRYYKSLYRAMITHLRFRCWMEGNAFVEGRFATTDEGWMAFVDTATSVVEPIDALRTFLGPLVLRNYCLKTLDLDLRNASRVGLGPTRRGPFAKGSRGIATSTSSARVSIARRTAMNELQGFLRLKAISELLFGYRIPFQAQWHQFVLTKYPSSSGYLFPPLLDFPIPVPYEEGAPGPFDTAEALTSEGNAGFLYENENADIVVEDFFVVVRDPSSRPSSSSAAAAAASSKEEKEEEEEGGGGGGKNDDATSSAGVGKRIASGTASARRNGGGRGRSRRSVARPSSGAALGAAKKGKRKR